MTDDYMIHYDVSYEPVRDRADVQDLFDDDADMVNPQGTRGMAYFLGVADGGDADRPMRDAAMRVDLDPASGAGAVRWLPEGLIGIEDGYVSRPLRVCESSAADLVEVPAAIGRVSYRAAREAAERYIATGARPDNVTWAEDDG